MKKSAPKPQARVRMRAVTGVIPPELREELEEIAASERRTVSQVVRIAIEDHVRKRKSVRA